MKKTHLIILIITAIMALFSAYSLAAINQVYNIDFEWYSQYKNCFVSDERDTSLDKWLIDNYPNTIKFEINSNNAGNYIQTEDKLELPAQLQKLVDSQDYDRYVVVSYTATSRGIKK